MNWNLTNGESLRFAVARDISLKFMFVAGKDLVLQAFRQAWLSIRRSDPA